ncbi:MAG TPA: hypothetical protein VM284_01095 [Candidatus Limnocylindria bacterium]|nr:hypothetical protein [Candidatus Limnocylindria bacterium]
MAVVVAAAVFAVVVWLDAIVVKNAQPPPPPSPDPDPFMIIRNPGGVLLLAFGSVVVGGAAIVYAALAWWSRSLTASLIFFVGGVAEHLVAPALYIYPLNWPYYLNLTLTWWLERTTGPLNAAHILGGALVVSGALGLYRWAFTRQLALKDA